MKDSWKTKTSIVVFAAAIGLSLLLAGVIIALTSESPLQAFAKLLTGPLSSKRRIGQVITSAIPSIFTGLGLSVMFQAGQFNLSADGILYFCASMAAFAGIRFTLPAGLHPLVGILLCGMIGAVICTLPGVLKEKWGANIIVSSLMLNYILLYAGLFVLRNVIRDTSSGNMVSEKMRETAQLPELIGKTGIHAGVIIAAAAVAAVWLFLYRTRPGYDIRMVGSNPAFAQYTGIPVLGTVLLAQLLGGFLAGMGGAVELYGGYTRFEWLSNPGYGWDGFMVAVLAANNPLGVPVAALFLSYLAVGSDMVVRSYNVPPDVIPTIRGIMIVLVAAQGFLSAWKHKQMLKAKSAELKGEGEAAV